MSSNTKITLKSSDGETFEVDTKVAVESQIIKHIIDCYAEVIHLLNVGVNPMILLGVIPLRNVTSNILSKVLEYCGKHVGADKAWDGEKLKAWDDEFVKVDKSTLFDLILF